MSDDWLNYHHLYYFWTVAREGSITKASEKLHLAQPTVSGQLKTLEESFGEKLFIRSGRQLVLTDAGHTVFRYADEIFTIGRELVDTVRERRTDQSLRLVVGLPQVLPKLIAFRLLQPVLMMETKVQLVCREGPLMDLLSRLAAHELDVVFADSPATALVSVKAFSHALGECGIGIFGVPSLCLRYQKGIPRSLNDAPFIMPTEGTLMRRSIEQWISEAGICPEVIGEMDDTALMKVFAEAGTGFIPAPLAITKELKSQFGLDLLLQIPNGVERFYAITLQKRMQHPAVLAISRSAMTGLFAGSSAAEK